MRRIAIFGAGCFGRRLKAELETVGAKVVFFADSFSHGKEESGIAVISPFELKYRYEKEEVEEIIVAVSNYYALGDILLQLHEIGIKWVKIADPQLWKEVWECGRACRDLKDYLIDLDFRKKAVLTKLEYHVCDHCNLNCKGCSHFAPIYKDPFADLGQFEKDVKRLSELFAIIFRFRLMGGEPFLNPELPRFITIARRYLPKSRLEIVTNGLLLMQITDDVWDVIREEKAFLNISLYPPTYRIKDRIEEFLDERSIVYSFGSGLEQYNDTGVIEEFHVNLTDHADHNPQVAAAKCMGNRCHFLRNGKLSKCALPLLTGDINHSLNTQYSIKEADVVDLYDKSIAPWDMVKQLYYATPFCAFCSDKGTERFKWSVAGQKSEYRIEDYIISEK